MHIMMSSVRYVPSANAPQVASFAFDVTMHCTPTDSHAVGLQDRAHFHAASHCLFVPAIQISVSSQHVAIAEK